MFDNEGKVLVDSNIQDVILFINTSTEICENENFYSPGNNIISSRTKDKFVMAVFNQFTFIIFIYLF